MMNTFELILRALVGLWRSKAALQAEVLVLRHQLNILRRKSPKRFVLTGADRAVFVALYWLVPGVMDALAIIRPETVSGGTVPDFAASGAGNCDLEPIPVMFEHSRHGE